MLRENLDKNSSGNGDLDQSVLCPNRMDIFHPEDQYSAEINTCDEEFLSSVGMETSYHSTHESEAMSDKVEEEKTSPPAEGTQYAEQENSESAKNPSNSLEIDTSSLKQDEALSPGPIILSTPSSQLFTQITFNSVTTTRRVQLSELSEEQQLELLEQVPSLLKEEAKESPEFDSFNDCINHTLIDSWNDLQIRYDQLHEDNQKKQEIISQLEEQLEVAHQNQSKVTIQLRLLQNELQMNKLLLENSKLKFEERNLLLEEKLQIAQKEVIKMNMMMKEQHQKYLLMMKHNCSYYCHQQLGVGNMDDHSFFNESKQSQVPFEWRLDSVIFKPIIFIRDSFLKFVATNRQLEENIIEGEESLSTPQPSPLRTQSSYTFTRNFPQATTSMHTIDLFLRSPLFLMEMIYYEYSFLWYLIIHAFPARYPYLTQEILIPLGSMIYSRLPLIFFSNIYERFMEKFSSNEIVEDVINDLFFKWYQFLHLLENEDNIFYDFIERTFTRWNEEYLWQFYPFQALKALLPVPLQMYCEQYFLLGILGLLALGVLIWSYRIIFGAALLMIFVLVLPWISLIYLSMKSLLLLLYCVNMIIIAPIQWLFSTKKKKSITNPKKQKLVIDNVIVNNRQEKSTTEYSSIGKEQIPTVHTISPPPPRDEDDMI